MNITQFCSWKLIIFRDIFFSCIFFVFLNCTFAVSLFFPWCRWQKRKTCNNSTEIIITPPKRMFCTTQSMSWPKSCSPGVASWARSRHCLCRGGLVADTQHDLLEGFSGRRCIDCEYFSVMNVCKVFTRWRHLWWMCVHCLLQLWVSRASSTAQQINTSCAAPKQPLSSVALCLGSTSTTISTGPLMPRAHAGLQATPSAAQYWKQYTVM